MEYSLSSSLVGGSGSLNPDKLSLDLPFAITKSLTAAKGPTPTFVRASTGTYFGNDGYLTSAAINVARFDHDTSYVGSTILVQCIDCVNVYSDVFSAAERIPLSGIDVDGYPYFIGSLFTVSYTLSNSEWVLSYNGGEFEAYSTTGLSDEYIPYGAIGGVVTVITELACKGLLIEESSANIIKYSEDYTNPLWVKTASSVSTSPALSPAVGGCNRITMNAGSSSFPFNGTQYTTVTSRVVTVSAYARYVNAQWLWIAGNNGSSSTNYWASFDIQNKVVGGKLSGITSHNITNVGNGWCRIEMTYTETSAVLIGGMTFRVGNASTPTNSATTQAGTEQFDLWGVQLEAKAFTTSYIPTTSGTAPRSADLCSITSSAFTGFYNQTEGTILSSSSMPLIPSVNSLAYAFDNATEQERHNFRHNTSLFVTQVSGVTQAQFIGTAPTAGAVTKFAAAYKVADYAATKNGTLLTSGTGSFTFVPTPTQVYIGSKIGASEFLNGHVQYIKVFKKRLTNEKLQSLTT